jgi:hypothetical protein
MPVIRHILPITLLAAALAACGASPQAAAPSPVPAAPADAPVATAVPAATSGPVATPPPSATPQESAVPDPRPTQSPTTLALSRTTRPTPAVDQVPAAPGGPSVVGEVPADLLDKILADAAQRSGADLASIVVERGEAVEWPNGALGCPKPGVAYLQVVTAGYHLVLRAAGSRYDYRADARGRFLLCQPS